MPAEVTNIVEVWNRNITKENKETLHVHTVIMGKRTPANDTCIHACMAKNTSPSEVTNAIEKGIFKYRKESNIQKKTGNNRCSG